MQQIMKRRGADMPKISKYASMVYRFGQIYFDEQLAPYHIGCGQQFFLLHICQNPGITQFELANIDRFDKGTCARAVKKLEEQAYITRRTDDKDHRIFKLYVTREGAEVVTFVNQILMDWHGIISEGMSQEECKMAEKLMSKLAVNAGAYIHNR